MKQRLSNIELLRIISIFLILVFHANYRTFSPPTFLELREEPIVYGLQIFTEQLSVICVNIFIIISGWFGIHFSMKKLWQFVFQCLFFSFSIYFVLVLLGLKGFNAIEAFKTVFYLTPYNWFVKSYIILMILSPALNLLAEEYKNTKTLIIIFFIMQTFYGINGYVADFNNGYSALSFIGIYITARYLKTHPLKIMKQKAIYHFHIYLGIVLFCTIIPIALCFTNKDHLYATAINLNVSYINPLVIVEAFALFFCFNSLNIKHSSIINRVAASSYAVYLFHAHTAFFEPYFSGFLKSLNPPPPNFQIVVFTYLCLIFLIGILTDQIRLTFWNLISRKWLTTKE